MPCQAPAGGPPLLGCCGGPPPPTGLRVRGCTIWIDWQFIQANAAAVQQILETELAAMEFPAAQNTYNKLDIYLYGNLEEYYRNLYQVDYPYAFPGSINMNARHPSVPYDQIFGWKYIMDTPNETCREIYSGAITRIECSNIVANVQHQNIATESTPDLRHFLWDESVQPECCNEAP